MNDKHLNKLDINCFALDETFFRFSVNNSIKKKFSHHIEPHALTIKQTNVNNRGQELKYNQIFAFSVSPIRSLLRYVLPNIVQLWGKEFNKNGTKSPDNTHKTFFSLLEIVLASCHQVLNSLVLLLLLLLLLLFDFVNAKHSLKEKGNARTHFGKSKSINGNRDVCVCETKGKNRKREWV